MAELLFSGIQPTNNLHIGNYIGALKQWTEIQNRYRCFFCIVDLHAITVPQDPKKLRENTLNAAATYLAVGIDPKKNSIFVQSDVQEHAELGWMLQTITKMAELERMTQFKDKSKKHGEGVGTGLFTYPALMAADILLYDTSIVPVGEDQMQHVELTRTIARRFNAQFGETFTVPQALIQKMGARIMSLDDPKVKMSKSGSVAGYIALSDDADTIRKKIMRAVTDSGQRIVFDAEKKPALANLMTIYHHATGKTFKDIEHDFDGKGYGDFKKALAEAVIAMLEPIQKKLKTYRDDPKELERVLDLGTTKAHDLASKKMTVVRDRMGLGR
ncbi:MAG: tryptophan--tRNA ligase [Patescibacteria group bacterium]|jgi:tryptophanyl-tRNA synthetase